MTNGLLGVPQHVGMVVEDLEAARTEWSRFAGLKWNLFLHVRTDWVKDGRVIPTEMSVAYSTTVSPAVELIEEHSPEPLLPAPEGNHVGYIVEDMHGAKAELEEAGMTLHSALYKDDRFLAAYFRNPHGLLVEIAIPNIAAILLPDYNDVERAL
jgi:catechol 2,3-dioxygenase-like lactoylglutathione lyase family enzyme